MKDADYPGIETDAVALTDAIAVDCRAGPDGYVRLEATEALWTALCKGCSLGRHDLSALWFDDSRMHMALSAPSMRRRAIFSVPARTALILRLAFSIRPRCGLNGRCATFTAQIPSDCPMTATGSITACGQAGRREMKRLSLPAR